MAACWPAAACNHRRLHPADTTMREADWDDEDSSGPPSKSQVKRDMLALQNLGVALLELPARKLSELGLDERLIEALEVLRAITAHGARKRQMKYVGKLLRDADESALREALSVHHAGHVQDTAQLHVAESWRDRLLNEEAALAEWLALFPQSDTRTFRGLLKSARSEFLSQAHGDAARKGKSYRQLFRHIRSALNQAAPSTD